MNAVDGAKGLVIFWRGQRRRPSQDKKIAPERNPGHFSFLVGATVVN